MTTRTYETEDGFTKDHDGDGGARVVNAHLGPEEKMTNRPDPDVGPA
jgi:hypothetical protein